MNLEKTFCSGLRCSKTNTCDKWIGHLKKWTELNNADLTGTLINIAQYADHEGKCNEYTPLEDPSDE